MGGLSVEEILRIVEGHVCVDRREEESLQMFRSTVPTLSDPCNEHADVTHVTVSAVVASADATVLHLHKRLNMWLQPGGHIDAGETPAQAAWREAVEETGLDVAHPLGQPCFFHVDVHPGPRGHTHLDLRYLLLADDTRDPAPGEGESPHVRWFSWAEAQGVADPGLSGALLRARDLIRTYVR